MNYTKLTLKLLREHKNRVYTRNGHYHTRVSRNNQGRGMNVFPRLWNPPKENKK